MVILQPVKEKHVQTDYELILFDIHCCAFFMSSYQVDLIIPLCEREANNKGKKKVRKVKAFWC